jgi:hypothetical protein
MTSPGDYKRTILNTKLTSSFLKKNQLIFHFGLVSRREWAGAQEMGSYSTLVQAKLYTSYLKPKLNSIGSIVPIFRSNQGGIS